MNNITLITNDIDLYNVFSAYRLFDEVNISSSIDRASEYTYLIVSDRLCGINELIQYVESGMKAKKIIYLLSSSKSSQSGFNTMAALLKTHNISVLPPKLTDNQILQRFCELINLQERKVNNVVVLFGADSKVGTTVTAISLAENLAAQSDDISVAFLNLSGHISYSYVEYDEGKGMDSIRSKVFNRILSPEELKLAMVQNRDIKNFYMLPPCRTLIDFKYYTSEHIEYLINMAAGLFDAVIVDAGWYPHNGLYFAALNSSSNRYMVTTQQQPSLDNHSAIRHQALDEYGITTRKGGERDKKADSPENILLIINRFREDLSTNIIKEYDMVQAVSLPNVPGGFNNAEIEKRSLKGMNKYYDKQLDKLTNLVALQLDLKLESKKKARRLFGVWG